VVALATLVLDAGLLELIDTARQCQSHCAQFEGAGKAPVDQPLAVDMIEIVAKSHAAGCTRKP
jgi:hypothetical protein